MSRHQHRHKSSDGLHESKKQSSIIDKYKDKYKTGLKIFGIIFTIALNSSTLVFHFGTFGFGNYFKLLVAITSIIVAASALLWQAIVALYYARKSFDGNNDQSIKTPYHPSKYPSNQPICEINFANSQLANTVTHELQHSIFDNGLTMFRSNIAAEQKMAQPSGAMMAAKGAGSNGIEEEVKEGEVIEATTTRLNLG